MTTRTGYTPRRSSLATRAAVSVVLWAASVGAAYWYLQGRLPEGAPALPITDADSFGLPLVAFAGLLAGALIAANLLAAAVPFWRRRSRHGTP